MTTTIVIVIALIVLAAVTIVIVTIRERRDRALAGRLDESDPGAGLRAQAHAARQHEGPRGEAGGSSWSGAGQNSA